MNNETRVRGYLSRHMCGGGFILEYTNSQKYWDVVRVWPGIVDFVVDTMSAKIDLCCIQIVLRPVSLGYSALSRWSSFQVQGK